MKKTYEDLEEELKELRFRLAEANDAIEAIRTGQVDALVVQNEKGSQLYTIKSADHTYRVFIEKMKDGAVTLSKEGIILYSNSQFASIVNLPLAKVVGLSMIDFIHETHKRSFEKIIARGWQSNSKGEIAFLNKKNEWVPFLLSASSLELDQGVTALSLILTDLTYQKENEKQLQIKNEQLEDARQKLAKINDELEDIVEERTKDLLVSREYFKFLADNIPVIIWTADAEGKLDYVNQQWHEYTGYDLERSKTELDELVHPDDFENTSTAWQNAVKNRKSYEQEFRFKRTCDGTFRWHYAKAIPFTDESGNTTAWFGTSIDIDDQKKELEKKDEFISMASHELKTPMTSLKGFMQLIEMQKNLPDTVSMYMGKANSSLEKLQHLINDLLDASKIKAGKLKFDMNVIDLGDLVNECVENSNHIYSTHEIKTQLQKNIKVKGNAERIEQVLMNLVSNAVKYSPENKEIIVQVKEDNDSAVVTVIDYGIGLSEPDQKRIFERFFRVDDNKNKIPGMGMGLYISSEIIKEHNGRMSVKSKLKKGSEISFSIPLADPSLNSPII